MTLSFPREQQLTTPPLENGDRLTQSEFQKRYSTMVDVQKAELVEGITYLSDTPRFDVYPGCHRHITHWFGIYQSATAGVVYSEYPTLQLDSDNQLQPDAALCIKPGLLGRSRITSEGVIVGSPDLVVEITTSASSICLHDKLRAYRRNGVTEYIVWQAFQEKIDWFYLQEDRYISLKKDNGIFRSQTFPGLWMDPQAMLLDEVKRVANVRQAGLESSEHSAFVAKLSS